MHPTDTEFDTQADYELELAEAKAADSITIDWPLQCEDDK